ncbi:MAG TPA: hypothetical protein VFV66_17315 [Nonomuraea sp.]|nr:hypothetical protein [Nonomuraea sp.]
MAWITCRLLHLADDRGSIGMAQFAQRAFDVAGGQQDLGRLHQIGDFTRPR